jgi:hypothetical protein
MDYNAINFKNKDVDKFSTRFGNGDPKKKGDTPDRTNMSTPNLPTFETAKPKSTEKDWRERSVLGAVLHGTPIPHKDKGGKKPKTTESGKGGRATCVDDSCKKPAAWTN